MSDKSQEGESSRFEGGGQKDHHNRVSAFSVFNLASESNIESAERQMWRAEDLGVPRLDILMGGGVPRGSLALIVGPPGSGKTTLAYQIACAVAGSGRRAITFAALSEPASKLVSHLRNFRFFNEELLGGPLQIFSLQQARETPLEAIAIDLVAIARRSRADLVVLDGFRGVQGASSSPQAARDFLYSVGTQLGVLGITMLITSEAEPRDPAFFPEAATADVIIGLHYGVEGVRQRRAIEAVKVRGARPLPGLHGLRLTRRGVVIFPRLEAQIAADYNVSDETLDELEAASLTSAKAQPEADTAGWAPDAEPLSPEAETSSDLTGRAPFGLPELDVLLGGGLTRESSTVAVGSPGTGKTLLSLHFTLSGIQAGEKAVFLGMREDRSQLLRKADQFALGSRLRAALAPNGGLTLQLWPPVELEPDVIATHLLEAIDRIGAHRVVIDSIGELERTIARSGDSGRVDEFLAALVVAMRQRGVTALYLKEHSTLLAPEIAGATDALAVLAENVILLQHVGYRAELHRVLSVVKTRFSAHDTRLREFVIEAPAGIRVLAHDQSATGVLEGISLDRAEAVRFLRRGALSSTFPDTPTGTAHANPGERDSSRKEPKGRP
jgi:circadian clock protein KaiC